ncbi:YggT family protein [Chengkuizengella sediminis]|uniref:YggT family protein n=1 Tax=Chengkuizengella sediminis TaxID=1885917 RepID=UPI0013893C5E|nr:YggT family protein [Chengkuizengella sediminis]NDI33653.1 YggT family protein [Chengkuizengella sediminis]
MSIEQIIGSILQIYFYMIVAYVLLSWVPNARDSFIGELLGKAVEPYLSIFRKIIPPIGGMIDISPIIAIFALQFAASGLVSVISFLIGG